MLGEVPEGLDVVLQKNPVLSLSTLSLAFRFDFFMEKQLGSSV